MGFERQAAQNNPFMFSEFLFSRKVFFPINLGLCLIPGFMRPIRTEIPPFDSALEIVLTDVKSITKQRHSSDLSL
jgi:hypothetical protein